MPRFALERDVNFFKSISRELVNEVIETSITFYKLIIGESKTNLYGESLNKTYYSPFTTDCIIERDPTRVNYEGLGSDANQNVIFRFNRFTLEEDGFYPEIGDIIFHNDAYFEVDNVTEDQLIGGQTYNKFSIIVNTIMSRRTTIQTEERVV
jgi:hypothetical protein